MQEPTDAERTKANLQKKFGKSADVYASVRAEAAADAGSPTESEKWAEVAARLRDEEDE